MKITTILFDLDGTLLPMDQEIFTKAYFGGLAKRLAPYGYEPQKLIDAVWIGTKAMIKNSGEKTNEEAFWDKFDEIFGEKARKDIIYFDKFYQEDFDNVKISCGFNPEVPTVINKIKEKGFRLALATNPIFPSIATQKRIKWAGLTSEDFEIYTTYENSRYCKPNPVYYMDILNKLGVKPEECLMVGNDVTEDMVAQSIGMKVFLVTDFLINKENKDISVYPSGNFQQLLKFIDEI